MLSTCRLQHCLPGAVNTDLSYRAEGGELNLQVGDALTAHPVQLSVGGGTEALGGVSELQVYQPTEQFPSRELIPREQKTGTVTVVLGAEHSQLFTHLIDGNTQPETASLSLADATGNPTKQYTLQEPTAIKIDNPEAGNAQSITHQFANLTVGQSPILAPWGPCALGVDHRLAVDRDLRRDSCGMLLVLSHFNWHRPLSLAASVGHSSTVLHAATRNASTLRDEQRPQTVTARQYGGVALYRSAMPFSPATS
ncbi:MAG: hypothetical protein WCD21_00605 [Streptomyces sp.]